MSCWTWNRKGMFCNNAKKPWPFYAGESERNNQELVGRKLWTVWQWYKYTIFRLSCIIQICYMWPPIFFLFIRVSHLFVLHSSSSTLVREYTKRICFLGGWAAIYWDKCSGRVRSLSILELIFCHALCDISSIMSTGIQMTKIWLALDLLNGQPYFLYWTVKDFALFKHWS